MLKPGDTVWLFSHMTDVPRKSTVVKATAYNVVCADSFKIKVYHVSPEQVYCTLQELELHRALAQYSPGVLL